MPEKLHFNFLPVLKTWKLMRLLSILKKPYDWVNWTKMCRLLEKMASRKSCIDWVRLLYNNTKELSMINWNVAPSNTPRRGVRQCDHLSAPFFLEDDRTFKKFSSQIWRAWHLDQWHDYRNWNIVCGRFDISFRDLIVFWRKSNSFKFIATECSLLSLKSDHAVSTDPHLTIQGIYNSTKFLLMKKKINKKISRRPDTYSLDGYFDSRQAYS